MYLFLYKTIKTKSCSVSVWEDWNLTVDTSKDGSKCKQVYFFYLFSLMTKKDPPVWKNLNLELLYRQSLWLLQERVVLPLLLSKFNNCSIRGCCYYVRHNKTSFSSIIYDRFGQQYCFFFNRIILNICMLNLEICEKSPPKKKR